MSEARLNEIGYPIASLDALAEAKGRDPDLDIQAYVDARPDLYEDVAQQIAAETGMTRGQVITLALAYASQVVALRDAMERLSRF